MLSSESEAQGSVSARLSSISFQDQDILTLLLEILLFFFFLFFFLFFVAGNSCSNFRLAGLDPGATSKYELELSFQLYYNSLGHSLRPRAFVFPPRPKGPGYEVVFNGG